MENLICENCFTLPICVKKKILKRIEDCSILKKEIEMLLLKPDMVIRVPDYLEIIERNPDADKIKSYHLNVYIDSIHDGSREINIGYHGASVPVITIRSIPSKLKHYYLRDEGNQRTLTIR